MIIGCRDRYYTEGMASEITCKGQMIVAGSTEVSEVSVQRLAEARRPRAADLFFDDGRVYAACGCTCGPWSVAAYISPLSSSPIWWGSQALMLIKWFD